MSNLLLPLLPTRVYLLFQSRPQGWKTWLMRNKRLVDNLGPEETTISLPSNVPTFWFKFVVVGDDRAFDER